MCGGGSCKEGRGVETISCTTQSVWTDKNPDQKHYIIAVIDMKATDHSWDQQEGQRNRPRLTISSSEFNDNDPPAKQIRKWENSSERPKLIS